MSIDDKQSGGPSVGNFRPIGGLIYGVIAFVIGMGVTIGLFIKRVGGEALQFPNLSEQAVVKVLGWTFYNAHTVTVESTTRMGPRRINFLTEFPAGDPLLFHAIPAFLLLLAGYTVANRTRQRLDAGSGAVAGASVLVGYGTAAVAGVMFLKVTTGGVTLQPSLTKTVMFMVVGYPVVFGGLGGVLKGM